MCGIAGAMSRQGNPIDPALLALMGSALAHRGPDGSGRYLQDDVGLVHTRLAIIDLATGDQPLLGPGGLALIANGEIYNDPDLRQILATAPFRTRSDCEPPLFLYAKEGVDFAASLRGMYAIALHDREQGRLVLARDRFGIKPLYYAETEELFLFASEPQALLTLLPRLERQPARDELLQLQFTAGRRTIFEGILRVMPGETLVIEQGRIVGRQTLPALPVERASQLTEAAALRRLDQALIEAVDRHQRADVPYGLFLSGGIDSAVLLSAMARLNERPVLSFTARFPETDVADESALALRLARALGAEAVTVDVTEADFWQDLPRIAAMMDDPAADYAILPTAKLASVAASQVKVVLSGEGGDEIFAGYGRYRTANRPWPFGRAMRRHGALDGLDLLRAPLTGWRDGMIAAERAADQPALTRLQRSQAVDCADWLPNDLLIKLDRCLMHYGIEGRVPMLDLPLAALGFGLPDDLKLKNGQGKYLLRRWLADHCPAAEPFARKQGFTVPVANWLSRRPELGALLARQPAIQALCRPGAVEALFERLDRRRGFAGWSLLFYALWHRRHILGQSNDGSVWDVLSDSPEARYALKEPQALRTPMRKPSTILRRSVARPLRSSEAPNTSLAAPSV